VQNFHPLFVHFPIALLLTSVAATFAGALLKRPNAPGMARALLYLGTLAAAVTAVTGFLAAQSVSPVAGTKGVIEEHQNYAYVLLAISAALSGWAFASWRRAQAAPRPAGLWLAGQLALVVLVVLTAKEGGELVHEHGVGTSLTAPGGPLHDAAAAHTAPADSTAPKPTGRDFK
jgi:uncharacterized membrane protein